MFYTGLRRRLLTVNKVGVFREVTWELLPGKFPLQTPSQFDNRWVQNFVFLLLRIKILKKRETKKFPYSIVYDLTVLLPCQASLLEESVLKVRHFFTVIAQEDLRI